MSKDPTPPACFHCNSSKVILRYRGSPPRGIPYFNCQRCGKGFNRRTGTALQSFLRAEKLNEFLPLLSQQRSIASASLILDVSPAMVQRWVKVFRVWLLKLDSTGHWEAQVKLGMQPELPPLTCPKCGNETFFFRHGFVDGNQDGKRMFRCKLCNRCVVEPDEHFRNRRQAIAEISKAEKKKPASAATLAGYGHC
ncbi:DUF746 domain-containing protein [Pseudomonas sp. SCB32]|uniref:DUF746 domain-containing protein n=1 Tax=Pseudomonas sp. SCB32 TaxID=2653853 RepID=UPI0015B49961|nr:DUF746 domain-containing protein [Pseudomonas sp. SCB32]